MLPEAQWAALSPAERIVYDEARIDYHSEMVIVATSTVRRVAQQGRLLAMLNRRESSARRGLIVSGAWTTGKSTALKQLGRTHELMVRQRFPGQDRIPVVYVTTPPKGSRANWPRSSPGSSACHRSSPGSTPPTSPTRSARSSSTPAATWCWSTRSTTATSPPRPARTCPTTSNTSPSTCRPPSSTPHQRRTQRPIHRGSRQADRRPLRAHQDSRVSIPSGVEEPDRDIGRRAAAAPPRARHAHASGSLPAQTHRWHDRQPVAPGPGRRAHRDRLRRRSVTRDLLDDTAVDYAAESDGRGVA
jgi:hypothetical protein